MLTEQQKSEIKTNCLDALCEDMSFPADERMELTWLAGCHIQGLITCKRDTTLAYENEQEAIDYLIDLFGATL